MILGRVTGTVHATVKNAHLEGLRFLVEPILGICGPKRPTHHVEALFEHGAVSESKDRNGPLG